MSAENSVAEFCDKLIKELNCDDNCCSTTEDSECQLDDLELLDVVNDETSIKYFIAVPGCDDSNIELSRLHDKVFISITSEYINSRATLQFIDSDTKKFSGITAVVSKGVLQLIVKYKVVKPTKIKIEVK